MKEHHYDVMIQKVLYAVCVEGTERMEQNRTVDIDRAVNSMKPNEAGKNSS